MPSRSVLMKRLEDHFVSKGHRVVERSSADGFIKFRKHGEETVVRIIDELASRDEMLATIIQSALDSGGGKIAYVSIPMNLVSRLGDYAFRVNKIGVLVYDERDLVEIVEGGVQTGISEEKPETETTEKFLQEKIENLESLYAELAKKIEAIEARINELATRSYATKQEASVAEPVEKTQQTPARKAKKPEALPSFIEDNPWVELLSNKR